jgi:hypothetical protein
MKQIDLNRPLTADTKARILDYLEKRPLGEVMGLFTSIINQLAIVEPNGQSNSGDQPNTAGSGDASVRSNSLPAMATKQGSGGTKDRAEDLYRRDEPLCSGSKGQVNGT